VTMSLETIVKKHPKPWRVGFSDKSGFWVVDVNGETVLQGITDRAIAELLIDTVNLT